MSRGHCRESYYASLPPIAPPTVEGEGEAPGDGLDVGVAQAGSRPATRGSRPTTRGSVGMSELSDGSDDDGELVEEEGRDECEFRPPLSPTTTHNLSTTTTSTTTTTTTTHHVLNPTTATFVPF